MGILGKLINDATKPIRAKVKGASGERKVDSKLNPLLIGRVEHRQINNLILVDDNGKSHQIDHVEIRENGVFCIETKNYGGLIYGNENNERWTQVLNPKTKNHFLNPLKQNKSHCFHLSKALGPKYKINSLVVMVQNNAGKINCPNVIDIDDLKKYLKNFDNGVHFGEDEMDFIYQKLLSAQSTMSNKEHVKNIKQTQKELDKNICPRCGSALVLRKSSSGNFYGCSNYPKCKFTKKA